MKLFMLFTASILLSCSSSLAQEKMKTKTNDTKVKVKGGSMINANNSLQNDSIQAAELVRLSKVWMDAMKGLDKPVLEDLMAPYTCALMAD